MKKKRVMILISLLFLISAFAFAGGNSEKKADPAGKAKITVWHFSWSPNFEGYITNLAKQYMP